MFCGAAVQAVCAASKANATQLEKQNEAENSWDFHGTEWY
jgi:hypothetical protein